MERLKEVISFTFTHKSLPLDLIGKLHIPVENIKSKLTPIKNQLLCEEILYISTCNRVEFVIVFPSNSNDTFDISKKILNHFVDEVDTRKLLDGMAIFKDYQVVKHLISVASSIDSVVIGEREIITQVRLAFEACKTAGLSGDYIRLMIRSVLETAKKVYSQTSISKNPVSIVSLAFRELKKTNIQKESRFLIIGAGVTNTTLCRFLKKHGFSNFSIFNRTLDNAKKLCDEIGGKYYSLEELENFNDGFDVLISCTATDNVLINGALYEKLLNGEKTKKIIIDLAIPNDIDVQVLENFSTSYLSIEKLKEISESNIQIRKKELKKVYELVDLGVSDFIQMQKIRSVEIAMRKVPNEVKKIKQFALQELFSKDLNNLDENSKEVLHKVIDYLEKKYISVPMKMAKEILLAENKADDL